MERAFGSFGGKRERGWVSRSREDSTGKAGRTQGGKEKENAECKKTLRTKIEFMKEGRGGRAKSNSPARLID